VPRLLSGQICIAPFGRNFRGAATLIHNLLSTGLPVRLSVRLPNIRSSKIVYFLAQDTGLDSLQLDYFSFNVDL